MSLFRGISFIILGDQAYRGYPQDFAYFGQGYFWWVISFEFVLFSILAVVYGIILHMTNFGRAVYAIGNNPTGALFSGIRVNRVKFVLFLLTGLMSGVAAICLTSRLGSTSPSIASQEAAAELGGVEIIYTGPTDTTAEGQIEVINSLIAQGVDAIAISANDPDALVPSLKKAMSRGITVISWDSGVAQDGRQMHLNPS